MNVVNLDVSVAIPTYNGESRLPKLLEKLLSQINTEEISWEIIIVDNNSQDSTAKIVKDYQNNWNHKAQLRYYFEGKQGAAFARLQAVKQARGELIAFLDDDIFPNPDWIAMACSFAQKHPEAGAWSGQIHGDFEVKIPENFERIQNFLAIREYGSQAKLFEPENLRLPPAASLVVRKKAWNESVPQRPILIGRVGSSMVGGEDYEPLLYMYKAGWKIWYNPAMHTYHHIPQWRLEKKYLFSLAHSCGLTICYLRMINSNNWQKPIIIIRTILGNLRRIVLYLIKYKRQIKNDTIAQCELNFFIGSLMSPFYYLHTISNQMRRRESY